MKGIVFRHFSINVDFYICFKSNGKFKYVQVIAHGDQTRVWTKVITSDKRQIEMQED